jgi:RNA polymerase sigma factor (TIGR02999 family)
MPERVWGEAALASRSGRLATSPPPVRSGQTVPGTASAITTLLEAHARGERGALDRLFEAVYDELRRVARAQKRRRPGAAFDTVELVHELYLKLAAGDAALGGNREHFLAIAASAVRHLLVDQAKAAKRAKRGGGARHVTLSRADGPIDVDIERVLAIDGALERLARLEPRLARVVECRWFVGFSEAETAGLLGVSLSTVQRDWRAASKWLARELGGATAEAM